MISWRTISSICSWWRDRKLKQKLNRDPVLSKLQREEAAARRAHKPVRGTQRAKRARMTELLGRK